MVDTSPHPRRQEIQTIQPLSGSIAQVSLILGLCNVFTIILTHDKALLNACRSLVNLPPEILEIIINFSIPRDLGGALCLIYPREEPRLRLVCRLFNEIWCRCFVWAAYTSFDYVPCSIEDDWPLDSVIWILREIIVFCHKGRGYHSQPKGAAVDYVFTSAESVNGIIAELQSGKRDESVFVQQPITLICSALAFNQEFTGVMRSLQPGFWGVPAATSEGGVEFELKMGVRDFLPILVLSDDSRLVMQYLLTETGVDVNHRHPLFGSALYNAAAINNADIVKLLLSKGANVNQTGGRWYTSLQMSVAHSKSTDTLSVLLQAGADVNQQGGNNDNGRQTALMTAAHANNRKAVAVLLSQPEIDINLLSCREETIAHFLSRAGDADNLRKLIAEHPEVDIKCSGLAGTALNAATYLALSQFTDGHDEVVKILLEQGLSPLETPPGEEFSIHGWAKYLEKEAEEEEQEFPAALERILRWRKYSRESIK